MNNHSAEKEPMYSRRVTKSEEEFLREFEAELQADDFDNFLNYFDDAAIEMEPEGDLDLGVADTQEESENSPLDVFTQMGFSMASNDEMPKEEIPIEEIPIEEIPVEEIPVEEKSSSEEFSLGGVDLGALLSETTEEEPISVMSEPESSSSTSEPMPLTEEDLAFMEFFQPEETVQPMQEPAAAGEAPLGDGSMEDMFANLFGEDAVSEAATDVPLGGSSESIDLSNLGEADLMSLLAGEDGLSDIGSMLSGDGTANMGEDDAFAMFAESEMAAQTMEESEEDDGNSKKKKKKKKDKKKDKKKKENAEGKGGFLGKLSGFFAAFMEDDEEDEVELKGSSAPTADQLSGENAEILAAFQDIEDQSDKKGKGKKKKEKKKKEKKEKPKKEKKEKKPKKPKEPKPKKEKKPKEKDNTPPLPKGPVIAIWLMAISIFALVMLGVNLIGYSSAVSNAKSYHNNGEYAKAYAELIGFEIKEKDTLLYNQAATLAAVDSELNAFDSFLLAERHEEALDSLICAAGRCLVNEDNAEMYECQGQMQILQAEVTNKLYANYGMTFEEAIEIYESKNRDSYSLAVIEKLRGLGLVE